MKSMGIALILVTGLLTFHPPHFLLEGAGGGASNVAGTALEIGLAINLLAAIVAGVAIWRDAGWGWALGLLIALGAVALYLAQETLGLPGLPKEWLEPSRIVALAVEALFIALSIRQLRHGRSNSSRRPVGWEPVGPAEDRPEAARPGRSGSGAVPEAPP